MEMSIVGEANEVLEQKVAQAEADIKALAESVEKLLGAVGQLKAVQDETLAVMKQLLQRS